MTETDSSSIGHDPLGSGRAETVVREKGVLFSYFLVYFFLFCK